MPWVGFNGLRVSAAYGVLRDSIGEGSTEGFDMAVAEMGSAGCGWPLSRKDRHASP